MLANQAPIHHDSIWNEANIIQWLLTGSLVSAICQSDHGNQLPTMYLGIQIMEKMSRLDRLAMAAWSKDAKDNAKQTTCCYFIGP